MPESEDVGLLLRLLGIEELQNKVAALEKEVADLKAKDPVKALTDSLRRSSK